MELGQWGVVVAILLGAAVLGLAVAKTLRVRQLVVRDAGWKTWRLLHALMIFFLIGYVGAAFAVFSGHVSLLLWLLGVIFFFGAAFVWLVVRATLVTLEQMKRQRVETQAALDELKAAQAQLVQNGRLVALGHLAAGIAHELNQPLMAVEGVTTLLRRRWTSIPPDAKELVERIVEACDRMARIVNNVRSFGRQDGFSLRPTAPVDPMENALMLINEQFGGDAIRVERRYEEGLPTILADEYRLQQVFLNLLANARDALRQVNEEQRVIRVAVERDGETIVYSVEDDGPGIDSAHAEQLFDPFFTTKEVGEGTGLGLSIAFGIALEHRGVLSYDPESASGARFRLRIPTSGALERRLRQTGPHARLVS